MDILLQVLPFLGGTISVVNVFFFMYLRNLEKDLERERKEYREFRKETEGRLRRMEFFLDKRFSFSSLPDGYK
ncbi:MAG: hypothetical protein QNJ65_19990 [Xenococcaceae cyanobacterium MO_234.B1]|nr:hypothetical protein [Xenococcaceae cyanobacterium MO_234.B1]